MFGWQTASGRLKELEEAFEKHVHECKERDLDYVELRARCKRLLDRTEKAAKAADAREPVLESDDPQRDGEGAASNGTTHPGAFLTPRQKAVQQQILRRRAGIS